MKKLSTVLLSSVLTFVVTASPVFAQVKTPTSTGTEASAGAVMEVKDDYLLPYPGILPDHPLYFLKALRDRILEGLIVDPLRKAEFYILQADKRLNMGLFFNNQGKNTQMEEVISKGEKYMEKAVSGLVALKTTGVQIPASVVDRLEKSLVKHTQILEGLIAQVNEAENAGLTQSLALIQRLQGELGKLK